MHTRSGEVPQVPGSRGETLRILQVINNLEIGGAQEVVRTLSGYLVNSGYPVVVCTFNDGPLRSEIERLGVPVEILPRRLFSITSLPNFLREIRRIRQQLVGLVEKYQIDIIQTHLLRALDFLVVSLRWRSERPLVFWTIHNANFSLRPEHLKSQAWLLKPKQFSHRWLYRLAARRVNGFIAVADEVENSILATIGPVQKKITVITNGVDVPRYQQIFDRTAVRRQLAVDEAAPLITVVGTLKEQKGHRFLIDALPPVVAQHPDLQVLLVGDGPLRLALEEQVQNASLQNHIHFLGNRSDVPELLASSDYFILPSLWEGLPMALIEAMASSLPVIATRVSGTQQVVEDGVSGVLVPPGDPVSLQAAMLDLLASPEKASAMGEAALQRVEICFSARKQAQDHLQLFHKEWDRINNEKS